MLVMCSTSLPASVPHFCDGDGDDTGSVNDEWVSRAPLLDVSSDT